MDQLALADNVLCMCMCVCGYGVCVCVCVCVWQGKDEAVYISQQHDQLRDCLVLQD